MKALTFLARRFVAGETAPEAVAAGQKLQARGIKATFDLLGEDVLDRDAARRTAEAQQGAAAPDPERGRAEHLDQARRRWARRSRATSASRTPPPSSRRRARWAASCASTWRARRPPTRPSTSSTSCGRGSTTWGSCSRPTCTAPTDDVKEAVRARRPGAPVQGRLPRARRRSRVRRWTTSARASGPARASCWTRAATRPSPPTTRASSRTCCRFTPRSEDRRLPLRVPDALRAPRPERWDELVAAGPERAHLRALRHALDPLLLRGACASGRRTCSSCSGTSLADSLRRRRR